MAARKRINISLLIPFLVIALVFGVLIWQKHRASRVMPSVPHVQKPSGARTAVLFFVADGTRLAREARELEPCDKVEECVKGVLEELFNGPVGELDEALPEGTILKGIRIEGDTAVVDVNRNFAVEMPSGSSAEMLAVYSIVDTICINFPLIARVKLTIEGEQVAALRHLDIAGALLPDYTLEQQSAQEPAGKSAKPNRTDEEKGHP